MLKKLVGWVLGMILVAGWAWATPATDQLTWEDCVLEALAHDPALRASEAKIRQAEASRRQALAPLLPQVSADVGTQWMGGNPEPHETRGISYGLSLRQTIFSGGSTSREWQAAEKDLAAQKVDWDLTSATIRLRLRQAYIELLRTQALVDLTKQIEARRRQNVQLVTLRYQAGREHRGSLLFAEAQASQAEVETIQAKRSLALALNSLNVLLQRDQNYPLYAEENLQLGDLGRIKPVFEDLTQEHPAYRQAGLAVEASRLRHEAAFGALFPSLDAGMNYGRSNPSLPLADDQWSVGLSLSIPLFQGGRNWQAAQRAQAVWEQRQQERVSLYNTLYIQLVQAWSAFQDATDNVAVQEKFYLAGEERALVSAKQYSAGLISFDAWSIIEDDFAQVRKSYLQAQINALIRQAEWVQAQGGTLANDIQK